MTVERRSRSRKMRRTSRCGKKMRRHFRNVEDRVEFPSVSLQMARLSYAPCALLRKDQSALAPICRTSSIFGYNRSIWSRVRPSAINSSSTAAPMGAACERLTAADAYWCRPDKTMNNKQQGTVQQKFVSSPKSCKQSAVWGCVRFVP